MRKLFVVTKNELLRYFISPLAYVYLIAFLLLNGSFAIYFGNFFDRGQADLLSMFSFQPWLYLLFIPGISMRLWSEEFRNKTIIQIMTMPVSASTLVWGKFFASWLFCALALVLTFPFWLSVNYLGSPDNNVIAISYLGSFALAGCMLSISQTMSALTKNQVIALVLSVVANLIFFLSGLEYILSLFRLFAPLSIIDMIASFSFLTHFETISKGLLELRDIIFFTTIILLFNFTTILVVSFKTAGTSKWLKSNSGKYYATAFACLLLGFIGLNLLANNLTRNIQYDFTDEQIFTLTDTTKNTLRYLPEPITAKLYYSPILGERNPQIRLMFDKIRILLRQYANLSDGKFDYRIYNPKTLDEIEDQAITAGLQPIPVIDLNSNAFLGLTLTDALDNKQIISFFPLERQNFLEQDLTQKIFELTHPKKTIGIISSLPIFDTVMNNNVVSQKWEIVNQIAELYKIKNIKTATDFTDDLDVLMIINPQNPTPEMISQIKRYSLQGVKTLLILDTAAEAPRIFSPINHEYVPSYLGDLSDFWGFVFHNNVVVADLDNSITVDATNDYKNNPTFTQDVVQFVLNENNFNQSAPETANLKNIMFASASALEPITDQITFEPLIQTSANSAYLPAQAIYDNINPSDILRSFKSDNTTKTIAAKITSLNDIVPFELIVIGDSDFLYDSFWTKTTSMTDTQYAVPVLDNGNLVLNALESLSGGDNLIELRGKSAKTRKFDDIEKMRRNSQLQFKIKEDEIVKRINQTKVELQEIWGKKDFENRQTFTTDELAIIAGIRKKLEQERRELSSIRHLLNQDIDTLNTNIKLINIYIIPLGILGGLLIFALFKNRRQKTGTRFIINAELLRILLLALVLLGLGIASTYFTESQNIEKYEGKPVFTELPKHVNDIREISLKNHFNELVFYLDNGIWKLKGNENFPVYQERIRSFLSAIIEATYYEKKSSKAEFLSKFGLQSQEIANSPNIRIELKDARNQALTSFEVGKYDIDIGRGAKAAYIKFNHQFQVWLIAADFIDLAPIWQNWTYSSLWNLRFGRLSAINNNHNSDFVANYARLLLNTYFIGATDKLIKPEKLFQLSLRAEDNNQLTITFYKSQNRYYANYHFNAEIIGNHLQNFAENTKDKFFEITENALEKIQDANRFKKK